MSRIQPPPLVTSVSTQLKHHQATAHKPLSDDDILNKKQKYLAVLDQAADKFIENLNKGNVELDSTLDLERIVKLTLILSGEADSITGSTGTETTTNMAANELSMSKIEEILDLNDPEVKAMYDKIYSGYNQINDGVAAPAASEGE